MELIQKILALFLVMGAGVYMRRKNVLDDKMVAGLNAVILNYAMPALMISSLQRPYDGALLKELGMVFAAAMGVHLGGAAIGYAVFRKLGHGVRQPLWLLAIFSNNAYIGFPLIASVFGEGALIYGVMYSLSFNIMLWTVGMGISTGSMEPRKLLSPGLVSIFGGMLLFVLKIKLPVIFSDALSMLGSLTIPLSMLLVGVGVSGLTLSVFKDKWVWMGMALRLVLLPLGAYGIFKILGVPGYPLKIMVLLCAMPGAAAIPIIVEKGNSGAAFASRLVLVSTALSLFTLPVWAMVMKWL